MTPKEFIALADKKGWQLQVIEKEVPPGSGRIMCLGFEYGKRSTNYTKKFLFDKPLWKHDLQKPPTPEAVQKFNEFIANARTPASRRYIPADRQSPAGAD